MQKGQTMKFRLPVVWNKKPPIKCRLKECLGAIMSFKRGSSQDRWATKFSVGF